MSNGSWTDSVLADGYSNLNTPTVRSSVRPMTSGLKIGALPVVNNLPFSQQAQTQVRRLFRYITPNTIAEPETRRQCMIDISTPSSRLRTGIQLYPEVDGVIKSDGPLQGSTPCIATLYAVGVNPASGSRSTMQVIKTYNPPFSVPIDPEYRDTRLMVQASNNNWAGVGTGSFPSGDLVLVVTWEPTTLIDPAELNRLYANCSVSIGDTVLV